MILQESPYAPLPDLSAVAAEESDMCAAAESGDQIGAYPIGLVLTVLSCQRRIFAVPPKPGSRVSRKDTVAMVVSTWVCTCVVGILWDTQQAGRRELDMEVVDRCSGMAVRDRCLGTAVVDMCLGMAMVGKWVVVSKEQEAWVVWV